MRYATDIDFCKEIECSRIKPIITGDIISVFVPDPSPGFGCNLIFEVLNVKDNFIELKPIQPIPCIVANRCHE